MFASCHFLGGVVAAATLLIGAPKAEGDCAPRPLSVLYSVAPHEGFNLRRDVYLRLAVAVRRGGRALRLVLPPWTGLPHWKKGAPVPWRLFFDTDALREYVPVAELDELIPENQILKLDRLYRLTNFEDPFEGGRFVDKWEFRNSSSCPERLPFWGFRTEIGEERCVAYQGSASKMFELLALHPHDDAVMFANAEILLHDEYGTAEYWKARKSVRFSKKLISVADEFARKYLDCDSLRCESYLSVHWRRGDFARGRGSRVPSIEGTARQIVAIGEKENLNLVFVATDANAQEFGTLKRLLKDGGLDVVRFVVEEGSDMHEGAVAIVDQIVCSKAAYFVGTHESTFTYRIQEEREIMGFDSDSTFNRLCPDVGECEKPSRWTIVN